MSFSTPVRPLVPAPSFCVAERVDGQRLNVAKEIEWKLVGETIILHFGSARRLEFTSLDGSKRPSRGHWGSVNNTEFMCRGEIKGKQAFELFLWEFFTNLFCPKFLILLQVVKVLCIADLFMTCMAFTADSCCDDGKFEDCPVKLSPFQTLSEFRIFHAGFCVVSSFLLNCVVICLDPLVILLLSLLMSRCPF